MEAFTETSFTALPSTLQNNPKMLTFGTKLKHRLSFTGRSKKPREQQEQKWYSIGLVFIKGSSPKNERRRDKGKGKAHEHQRAAITEPHGHPGPAKETTQQTEPATPLTPSAPMTREQKFFLKHLNEEEANARRARTQRRLCRRASRWCKGGSLPSLQDFSEMSSKEVADYLKQQNVSEEWIKVVVSQIEFVREKDEIPKEVATNIAAPPSTWPWTENFTMAMTIARCQEDRMSFDQIGYLFYQLIYNHDAPIRHALTKGLDRGESFSEMGQMMVALFGDTEGDGKGLVITPEKPYVYPHMDDTDDEESDSTLVSDQQQAQEAQQQPGEEGEIEDWFPNPEKLPIEKAGKEDHWIRNTIAPPPGMPLPKGYKMLNGRAYRVIEAKFCVPLIDAAPVGMPFAVRRRRRQRRPYPGRKANHQAMGGSLPEFPPPDFKPVVRLSDMRSETEETEEENEEEPVDFTTREGIAALVRAKTL